MDWLYYLLEANLYLLIFYGFYCLCLKNATFYSSNRYYLLMASISAFIFPVLQIGYLKPTALTAMVAEPLPFNHGLPMAAPALQQTANAFQFSAYLYPIYLFIAFVFAIKLVIGLAKIISIWLKSDRIKKDKVIFIALNGQATAFSFFNLLFIHPGLAHKSTVLRHEMVHIKQKHSLDILFFEILQIMCWFNPIIPFIKKDIQLLHEYIADELTTSTDMHKHAYAMFLIQNSFGLTPSPLTNQIFNQSILKRRINMLNKKRTAASARLRLLMVLPLGALMLCSSTMAFTKKHGYVDLLPEKSMAAATVQQEVPKVVDIKKQTSPRVQNIKKDQVKFPPPIEKPLPPIYRPKEQSGLVMHFRKDKKTGALVRMDRRYVLINGNPVADPDHFYGASNTESITLLNAAEGRKKYGEKAIFGAIEITGANVKLLPTVVPPPPRKDQVKFAPPVVRPDQPKSPPAIEARPVKNDGQVKFPPPVVKPDRAKNPPAIEERPVQKNEEIKFTPPVVKPDQPKSLPSIEVKAVQQDAAVQPALPAIKLDVKKTPTKSR